MDENRLDRLTPRQKDVLRLVFQNYDAKQIARALGLSPHTVNDHMRTARRVLGVARTMDAARMLAEVEHPDRMGTEPIGIGALALSAEVDPAAPDGPVAVRKDRYRLGPLTRLAIIVALAFGAAAATGALIEVADVITRLIQTRHLDLADRPHRQ